MARDPASSPLKKAARPIGDWLGPQVAEAMALEIEATGGSEVFFVARGGPDGVITEAEVAARGTAGAVPAIAQAARQGDLVIHNHPSGELRASEADLDVASRLGDEGIGFAIVDNECSSIYVVVEPHRAEPVRPLDLDEIAGFFQPDGPLAGVLDGYEPRRTQVEMALAAVGSFNDGRVVVIEAGTGVGKSLAYLVPAVLWATRNRRRVAVSTNTINLQEQLIGSDLPVLAAAGLEFRAVLVKGRRNYACLRKADEVRAEPDLFAESDGEVATLKDLAEWSFHTEDGSLSDLRPPPPDALWEEIATQPDDCTRARCAFYNDCHFYRARRRAAAADLLIVNHHLLFADLALRQTLGGEKGTAVLPSYSQLIIDEAHHVEEVATRHFGAQVTSVGLQRQMGRLQYRRRPTRGLVPLLMKHLLPLAAGSPQASRALERLETEVRPALARAAESIPRLFNGLARAAEALMPRRHQERRVRLTEDVESDPAWDQDGKESCRAIRSELQSLTLPLERLLRDLEPLREEYREDIESSLIDVGAVTGRLISASAALTRFVDPEDLESDATVRWLEVAPGRAQIPRITLATAPIEVGPHLARVVFGAVEGAVLSSATLAVDGSFDFVSSRLGLDRLEKGRLVAEVLPSPFDHERQVEFLIPEDLPEPTEEAHEDAVAAVLQSAIRAAGGRALVLMTSYSALQRLHERLAGPLLEGGVQLRRQGEAPRTDLLLALREGNGEALLATDSFWEGIDVRGEALSLLALTRLPFRVPTDPVLQARAERLEREGGNPFKDLLVPMAVLKFKQGMGRLIRHREDRGVALVLDPRILRKSYGRSFLDSLGWGSPTILSAEDAQAAVQQWFSRRDDR